MADTNHHAHVTPAQTEGDGISYRGLWVSMGILTLVTLTCYVIVWGFFLFMKSRAAETDVPRNALAGEAVTPTIVDGRIESSNVSTTPLLVDEPANLEKFQAHEREVLTSYGWVDQNAGTLRVPIDVAKDMVLQHGLPVREGGR